jgi:DNA modification methylase
MDVLPTMAADSIDACVTDPPYHLVSIYKRFANDARNEKTVGNHAYGRHATGFMGKQWDGGDIAFRVETWREVYRVLKPGAHLLAFGGTRTFHRMACAIEDAGFEVRDTLSWNFGSGFPKSHNIGKKLDDQKERCACQPDLRNLRNGVDTEESFSGGAQQDMRSEMQCGENISGEQGENTRSADSLRDLRETNLQSTDKPETKQECVLQLFVPQQDIFGSSSTIRGKRTRKEMSSERAPRQPQPSMEGRCDLSEAPRELRQREIHPMPATSNLNGEAGRLCDGASGGDGWVDWPPINADGVCPPSGSPTAEQCADQSGTMAMQSQPQECGAWPYCERCGKPIVPDGFGTALKPAMELIVLARKPLSERTVAANVLRWGTGALNIDACRIPSGQDHADKCSSVVGLDSNLNGDCYGEWTGKRTDSFSSAGRWPANIILDGSDEVVAGFPETHSAGSQRDGGAIQTNDGAMFGVGNHERNGARIGDDGGSAARFFYTSKADGDDRLGSRHPTIKPLDLMQYLVRLVTPKGGLVLDPFAGSGTTGEAAFREGMRSVLIECDAEYLKDTERRIELLMAGPDERAFKSQKAKQDGKPIDLGPLFSGVMP